MMYGRPADLLADKGLGMDKSVGLYIPFSFVIEAYNVLIIRDKRIILLTRDRLASLRPRDAQ